MCNQVDNGIKDFLKTTTNRKHERTIEYYLDELPSFVYLSCSGFPLKIQWKTYIRKKSVKVEGENHL